MGRRYSRRLSRTYKKTPERLAPLAAKTRSCVFFFFNDTATTEIYTLSLHDALPIWVRLNLATGGTSDPALGRQRFQAAGSRSEEHTSELQSLAYLVCRLLLEKKKMAKMKRDLDAFIDSTALP